MRNLSIIDFRAMSSDESMPSGDGPKHGLTSTLSCFGHWNLALRVLLFGYEDVYWASALYLELLKVASHTSGALPNA